MLPKLTEEEFQRQVTDLATFCGGIWYHTHDSRHSAKGFPDLCLVKGKRLLFLELKSERGKLTPEQVAWLNALHEAGAETHAFWPRDWAEIEQELTR